MCDSRLRALLRGRPFPMKSPRSVSELTEQALDIPSNTIIDDSGSGFAYFLDFLDGDRPVARMSSAPTAKMSGMTLLTTSDRRVGRYGYVVLIVRQ